MNLSEVKAFGKLGIIGYMTFLATISCRGQMNPLLLISTMKLYHSYKVSETIPILGYEFQCCGYKK